MTLRIVMKRLQVVVAWSRYTVNAATATGNFGISPPIVGYDP